MFFWNRKKASGKEQMLPTSEKSESPSALMKRNTEHLKTQGIAFGKNIANHPMLSDISNKLSEAIISAIADKIKKATTNTCENILSFSVGTSAVTWHEIKSEKATFCTYRNYDILDIEEEYKLHGFAWALNSIIMPRIKAEYPQIVNYRTEEIFEEGLNGRRIKVTLFIDLKLNRFHSL